MTKDVVNLMYVLLYRIITLRDMGLAIETIKLRSRNNRTFFALMKKIMDIEIETDDLKLTEFDKAMHSFSDSK